MATAILSFRHHISDYCGILGDGTYWSGVSAMQESWSAMAAPFGS
jgi:hypothetical protein